MSSSRGAGQGRLGRAPVAQRLLDHVRRQAGSARNAASCVRVGQERHHAVADQVDGGHEARDVDDEDHREHLFLAQLVAIFFRLHQPR